MNINPKTSSSTRELHDLLAIVVCPISHGPLQLLPDGKEVASKQAMVRFPIVNGLLDLRLKAAQPLLGTPVEPLA